MNNWNWGILFQHPVFPVSIFQLLPSSTQIANTPKERGLYPNLKCIGYCYREGNGRLFYDLRS
jgi:hypothetical protein